MPTKPVDPKKWATVDRMTRILADEARSELENAVSCVTVGQDSDRAEFLEDVCEEYLQSVVKKVRLAMSLAVLSSKSMPKIGHGLLPETYGQEPGQDPRQEEGKED
jgi:hypothetical protein